jgi:NADPH2:quinone reductase
MRAIVMREFGPPEVLTPADVAEPVAGPRQALIAVELANITFVETQVRAGRPPHPAMAPGLPVIPGNGVGGVVIGAGPGVDAALLGARVVSATGGSGGYAERVAVPAAGLIAVPDCLGMAEAVALLADGRTALALSRAAAPAAGERVLVMAAAGGVGSLLTQLARGRGALVVGAAGGAGKVAVARELGAALAVDYSNPDWADRVHAEVGGVDVVFDGVSGPLGRAALDLVAPGGRVSIYGGSSGRFDWLSDDEAARRRLTVVRGAPMTPEDTVELSREAIAEAVAGRLRPRVWRTFPLEHAASAHAAMESREAIGKTLLRVSEAA